MCADIRYRYDPPCRRTRWRTHHVTIYHNRNRSEQIRNKTSTHHVTLYHYQYPFNIMAIIKLSRDFCRKMGHKIKYVFSTYGPAASTL